MKEYNEPDGYVRETVLIFKDPDLIEEDFLMMESNLSGYTGNHGEVITIKLLKNEDGSGAIILVVIVCFKSLLILLEVTDDSYYRFIEKQKNDFVSNYLGPNNTF